MSDDAAAAKPEPAEAAKPGSAAGGPGSAPAAEPIDDLVTTRHRLGELSYTATAGRVVLRQEKFTDDRYDGNPPCAELFLTAYTVDGADPRDRPVTFAFNGGPGSSSVWLHLGLLGPRRVMMGDVGALLPPPYGLADNHESLLTESDLVFIDPITTGYSRVVKGGKAAEYHGYTGDLETVGEVIRLWTSRHGRWMSPKYLCGESYGTTRAAALARHLQQRYGMYLNGLMLISCALDFGTFDAVGDNDTPYPLFLPTYAAIAHYHGRHGERPLTDLLAEAEAFAARDYPWALARADRLTADERAGIVGTLARLSGLTEEYVDQVNLRIEHQRFFAELMRPQRHVVGRLDGRFLGWDADYAHEKAENDPSFDAILGPYSAALNHYVRAELEYPNDLPYNILTGQVRPWSFKEFESQYVQVTDQLAASMRTNPHQRLYVASGYHDGATPYFATEHSLARLAIPARLRDNITVEYFEAGHMMYLHEPSRLAQSAQLRAFVQ